MILTAWRHHTHVEVRYLAGVGTISGLAMAPDGERVVPFFHVGAAQVFSVTSQYGTVRFVRAWELRPCGIFPMRRHQPRCGFPIFSKPSPDFTWNERVNSLPFPRRDFQDSGSARRRSAQRTPEISSPALTGHCRQPGIKSSNG